MENSPEKTIRLPHFEEELADYCPFNDPVFSQYHRPYPMYGLREKILFRDPGLPLVRPSLLSLESTRQVKESVGTTVRRLSLSESWSEYRPREHFMQRIEEKGLRNELMPLNETVLQNEKDEAFSEPCPPAYIEESVLESEHKKPRRSNSSTMYTFEEKCFISFTREQTAWKWEEAVKLFNERYGTGNVEETEEPRPLRNKQAVEFHYRQLKREGFSQREDVQERFKVFKDEYGERVNDRPILRGKKPDKHPAGKCKAAMHQTDEAAFEKSLSITKAKRKESELHQESIDAVEKRVKYVSSALSAQIDDGFGERRSSRRLQKLSPTGF